VAKRTLKRRRREGRTDYKLRLGLLKSGLPRIVIRRTNKYFIVQAVESNEAQDKIVMTVSSKELLKNGWNEKRIGSLKSIPAGYLTGFLFAKQIKKQVAGRRSQVADKYIVDLGMARTINGARVFAVVKGLVDGGLDISVDEKAFPSEERLMGEHLKDDVKNVIIKVREKMKND